MTSNEIARLKTVHFCYKTSGIEAAFMLTELVETSETPVCKELKMGYKIVEKDSTGK